MDTSESNAGERLSDSKAAPSSGFIFGDVAVPFENLVLVVYQPDPENLAVWMPRVASDVLTPEIAEGLIGMVADFVRNVPRRRA